MRMNSKVNIHNKIIKRRKTINQMIKNKINNIMDKPKLRL
jgi:hypothetical protein